MGTSDSIIDARTFDVGKAFVARIDANTGAFEWAHDAGATSASGATDYYVDHDLAVDRNGTAYFTFDSSSMNSSFGTNNLFISFDDQQLGNPEGFYQQARLATIDANGVVQQVQRFGSYDALGNFGSGAGLEVAVDDNDPDPNQWRLILATSASGQVYLGDAATLSTETTIGSPTSAGPNEGFYDSNLVLISQTTDGEFGWANIYGGAGRQNTDNVVVGNNGQIYLDGGTSFWGNISSGNAPLEF